MDTTRFLAYATGVFSPEMTSQWHQRWERPISKCAGMSYGSSDNFGDFSAHSIQTLWSLIGLPATAVAGADVKGVDNGNL